MPPSAWLEDGSRSRSLIDFPFLALILAFPSPLYVFGLCGICNPSLLSLSYSLSTMYAFPCNFVYSAFVYGSRISAFLFLNAGSETRQGSLPTT